MKKLAIIGSADLAQLIAYHAEADHHYHVAGFFDDFVDPNATVAGKKILGKIKDVLDCFQKGVFDELIIGIGYKHLTFRKKIFEEFASQLPIASVIHSSAYVDSSCLIGKGCFILPGCILDRNVVLKDNILLNTGCVIAHDSTINAHSFLSPGVAVAGFVSVGECCNIGIRTTIIDNITIVNGVQTGANTTVTKDILQPGLYVGTPPRFIR
jgi:sugar O-acyltransferase (sialic acid O-acetyltransferase NeuD family)